MLNRASALKRQLLAPEALRPYASISEQIAMSGSNMLASIVVVSVAGVSAFGVYSFAFVLSTLANGAFGTLLHRQMMLDIAAASEEERGRVFLSTLAIECAFMLTALLLAIPAVLLAGTWIDLEGHYDGIVASAIYVCLYNLFDLCRQFLYTTDNQVYSLRCTLVYISTQMVGLALIFFYHRSDGTVADVYLLFSLCLAISLASNRRCRQTLLAVDWPGWRASWAVFLRFFQQGRFSLIGMLVTWVQNQSMNPFLMAVSGPLVAGYFSLGRLLVMPMAVVSQGLVNSTTPGLRRVFKNEGAAPLRRRILSLINKNLAFALAYVTLVAIAHVSGLLERFVPDYAEVKWYLLLWILMLVSSMYRFWNGQFFVVSMRFRFLLGVGIAALVVSMSGMLTLGIGFGNVKAALLFVVVGELVSIALFLRERNRVLAQEAREMKEAG